MKTQRAIVNLGRSYEVAFSPCDPVVAAISRQVTAWSLENRGVIWKSKPVSDPSDIDFSPDGKLLAVKNTLGHIVVLDARTGKVIRDCKNHKDGPGCPALFSPCGRYLVDGSLGVDGSLAVMFVRDVSSGKVTFQQEYGNAMVCHMLAPVLNFSCP